MWHENDEDPEVFFDLLLESTLLELSDRQGPILQNFVSAEKLFGQIFFPLKLWTHFRPKATYVNLHISILWTNNLGCEVILNPC
jgi:hypothetical protein